MWNKSKEMVTNVTERNPKKCRDEAKAKSMSGRWMRDENTEMKIRHL